tara:strand:- start:1923 stop:2222 length:300 start_codon:yes stop_codon:yes gene_type:complete
MTADVDEIKRVLKITLAECLPLFKIHNNVEHVIRKKMLEIVNKNKEIGKLKNVETIVFTLMIYAIENLKIPINRKMINEQIQQYVAQKNLLRDLSHLKI